MEDAENEGNLNDYFSEDEFDNSNTSNDELGSEDDGDKELERLRKEKKSRKEELDKDLACGNAQTEEAVQGEETSNAIRVVGDENYRKMLRALAVNLKMKVMMRKRRRRLNQRWKGLDIQDTKAAVMQTWF